MCGQQGSGLLKQCYQRYRVNARLLPFLKDAPPCTCPAASAGLKATLYQFKNNRWSAVQGAPFSTGEASAVRLAADGVGRLWIAHHDEAADGAVTLMRRNAAGRWALVGRIPAGSCGTTDYISLQVDKQNVPTLAFQDTTLCQKASVMQAPTCAAGVPPSC